MLPPPMRYRGAKPVREHPRYDGGLYDRGTPIVLPSGWEWAWHMPTFTGHTITGPLTFPADSSGDRDAYVNDGANNRLIIQNSPGNIAGTNFLGSYPYPDYAGNVAIEGSELLLRTRPHPTLYDGTTEPIPYGHRTGASVHTALHYGSQAEVLVAYAAPYRQYFRYVPNLSQPACTPSAWAFYAAAVPFAGTVTKNYGFEADLFEGAYANSPNIQWDADGRRKLNASLHIWNGTDGTNVSMTKNAFRFIAPGDEVIFWMDVATGATDEDKKIDFYFKDEAAPFASISLAEMSNDAENGSTWRTIGRSMWETCTMRLTMQNRFQIATWLNHDVVPATTAAETRVRELGIALPSGDPRLP